MLGRIMKLLIKSPWIMLKLTLKIIAWTIIFLAAMGLSGKQGSPFPFLCTLGIFTIWYAPKVISFFKSVLRKLRVRI